MSDQVQGSTPGAGARAEYERRRARRLEREPQSDAPAHETSWLRGAQGEARLGARLDDDARLVGGVGVMHDLVLAGKRANIDHLVVGPAGVTVVDAKAWTGDVWVGRKVIGRGRRGRRTPIDGLQRQIHRVCTVLAKHGRDDVPVEGAVCFVNDNRGVAGKACTRIDGILVGATAPVSRHAMRPGRYSVAEVTDLMQTLRAGFVVSGGSCLPAEARTRADAAPGAIPTGHARNVMRRVATALALAVLAISAAGALLDAGLENAHRALAPATTAAAIRPQRAEYRALAERRARGAVRGPRVTEAGLEDHPRLPAWAPMPRAGVGHPRARRQRAELTTRRLHGLPPALALRLSPRIGEDHRAQLDLGGGDLIVADVSGERRAPLPDERLRLEPRASRRAPPSASGMRRVTAGTGKPRTGLKSG